MTHTPSRQLVPVLAAVWLAILSAGCQTVTSEPRASAAPPSPAPVLVAQTEPAPAPVAVAAPAAAAKVSAVDQQEAIHAAFAQRMAAVRKGLDELGSPELATEPYVKKLTIAGTNGRETAFPKLMQTLADRVKIEDYLLVALRDARVLYRQYGLASAQERDHLLAMNDAMNTELGILGDELAQQVKQLSAALDSDHDLPLFKHFAENKAVFVTAMHDKLQTAAELPDLDAYFDRWTALVKTRMLADRYQVINLAYYANAFHWNDQRNLLLTQVADMTTSPFLKDLGHEDVNAVNMATMLNASFGNLVQTAYPLPAKGEAPPAGSFVVSLEPDHGLGGVYYYSDSPEGLRNPTRVTRADGSYYFAERVTFVLKATRDCSFIMRHIDAKGAVTQICPNAYAPTANHLVANQPLTIPGDGMPFEFAASEPPGIEAIRVIVSPRSIPMNPRIDTAQMSFQQAMSDELAMSGDHDLIASHPSTTRGNTRGLLLQPRLDPTTAGSYDHAYFDAQASGNAVIAETFIRVLPLRH